MPLTPNQKLVLDLLACAPILVGIVAMVDALNWIWRWKSGLLTPLQQRRRQRRSLVLLAAGMGMLAASQVNRDLLTNSFGWHSTGFAGLFLIYVVMLGIHPAYRRPTERDVKRHFDQNPRHCGRCDYDLTGNVSGVCPECGWPIPPAPISPMRVEDPNWWRWWRRWRIDYLEGWRTKLFALLVGVLTTFGLLIFTVFMLFKLVRDPLFSRSPFDNPLLVILPLVAVLMAACFGVHLAITTLRIGSYGLRQWKEAEGRDGRSD
jgi:hypothetical protein